MRVPKHVGVIPDGNRRYACGQGLEKNEGYAYGLNPGVCVVNMAKAYGIEEITFYGFTTDNCRRPVSQVASFQVACVQAVALILAEGDVEVLVVGDAASKFFPDELRIYLQPVAVGNPKVRVNFLVNYGWKWDLKGIDGGHVTKDLKSKDISRMDMIIRWGGMRRLSGFLPVQSVYSDFYVVDALWPDYEDQHFIDAIQWYQKQDVTLGG
ncbi:MAG: undecaprenyl diphosphate synthase family protein [Defluviitaleaceae bacterium]|nr:undecaprenyl diphosphate synthase family protein [Defluviitaleaceae bacterium]